jgi:uncharacterized hydrophobic protein (TIGR00271 family)
VVHLRIVVPSYQAEHALDLLNASSCVTNLIYLERAARRPEGDVILCDVAREEASVIVGDLRELDIDLEGSIAIEEVDSEISEAADRAEEAAEGLPSDAVVWEQVESRVSDTVELSAGYLIFMALAMMIAAVGIYFDQVVLIVGAMVLGPEFGPIAGLCVAIVHRRADLARRSNLALMVGFPLGIAATLLATLALRGLGLAPDALDLESQQFTRFITHPDFFSFYVALLAGIAGMLSLTSAKSGALVGVLISVATIPAAANMAVAAAYAEWGELVGAAEQLVINMTSIVIGGVLTLFIQRRLFVHRRRAHLDGALAREAAGLPLGRSRRAAGRGGEASQAEPTR